MRLRVVCYLIVAGAILAGAFYLSGLVQGRLDAEDRRWAAEARGLIRVVRGHRRQTDTALAQAATAQQAATRWRQVAQREARAADSLGALAGELAADSNWYAAYVVRTEEVQRTRAALTAKSAEADTLASALARTTSALAQAQTDIDSLVQRLDQSLDRKDCRLLWVLGCPSRTASALIGLTVGVATTAVVVAAVN